jgi:hypothetical protein
LDIFWGIFLGFFEDRVIARIRGQKFAAKDRLRGGLDEKSGRRYALRIAAHGDKTRPASLFLGVSGASARSQLAIIGWLRVGATGCSAQARGSAK